MVKTMQEAHYETMRKTEDQHWWYSVRRKIIIDLVSKYVKDNNSKIVDIGCGTGRLLLDLQKFGQVYGVDVSKKALKFCQNRGAADLRLGSIANLPYDDNKFDIVLCLDVLEHIEDDAQAIKELKRIAKPGGLIIIFVPAFSFLFGVSDIVSNHFRRYNSKKLIAKIKRENLEVIRCSYFNFFLFSPILFVRKSVNFFKLPMKSENNFNNNFINKILYAIFLAEAKIIRHINLPFGVSLLAVIKKT